MVAIDKIEIDNIDKDGEKYIICMKINTQQINYTNDKDNNIIDGSKTEIIKVNEKWFFSRKISSKNQNCSELYSNSYIFLYLTNIMTLKSTPNNIYP